MGSMAFLLAVFFCLMATITVVLFWGHVWWMPELISVHGAAVDHELVLTLIIAGIAFFLAQVALGYFIWRFRGKGTERASNWHENRKLEILWTVVTAIVFVGLAIRGNRVWADYILSDVPANAMTVEVTAQQFAWNIRYPGPDGQFGRTNPSLIDDATGNFLGIDPNDPNGKDDITTQNIIAVPVNRPVLVILRTKDVTHSFFVPVLRLKQDAVPGMAIRVHFTAEKTGEYEVACAELCGMQHYKMRARFLVMQEEEFQNWLKARAGQ
jgi:cytochrome c oxidase subunit II